MIMTQKNRIHQFLKQGLATKVEDNQTTIAFGTAKASVIEGYKNEYKCKNAATGACSANFRKCSNVMEMCKDATNAMECTNKVIS